MTNEQQVIYLTGLKIQLLKAYNDGRETLAQEYPETIGFFRPLKTSCFDPLKVIIKEVEKQIEILTPFP